MMPRRKVRTVIVGFGNRARKYLRHLVSIPDIVDVVAVIDPDGRRLHEGTVEFGLTRSICFRSLDDFFASGIPADAAVVATPDASHCRIGLRVLEQGLSLLLEKPMAVTEEECRKLADSVNKAEGRSAFMTTGLCYVLRYHPYYNRIQELAGRPELGRITAVHHRVYIGIDRMTHTFVRGLWSRSEDSSPIFLSKCCHDVDWLFSLVGCRSIDDVTEIVSSGSLTRYCSSSAPDGSASRCVECQFSSSCRYSATDLYLRRREWTDNFIPGAGETKDEVIGRELTEGRFGRCVFRCDNDVEDFRRAEFRFRSGLSMDVTMDGLTDRDDRETVIEFEHGRITASAGQIELTASDGHTSREDWSRLCSAPYHSGSDFAVIDDFVGSVLTGTPMRCTLRDALPATIACLRAAVDCPKLSLF